MARSVWKGPFVDINLVKKAEKCPTPASGFTISFDLLNKNLNAKKKKNGRNKEINFAAIQAKISKN